MLVIFDKLVYNGNAQNKVGIKWVHDLVDQIHLYNFFFTLFHSRSILRSLTLYSQLGLDMSFLRCG